MPAAIPDGSGPAAIGAPPAASASGSGGEGNKCHGGEPAAEAGSRRPLGVQGGEDEESRGKTGAA